MVCGNPDVVVERGSTLVYCAGAIADLYAAMGGEVLYAGKPTGRSMRWRWQRLRRAAGRKIARSAACWRSATRCARILRARGRSGVDFLFVTSGIHAEELGGREEPDHDALTATFTAAGGMPKAVMRELSW